MKIQISKQKFTYFIQLTIDISVYNFYIIYCNNNGDFNMKEMLNVKHPEIYAKMFIDRMPENPKTVLIYGISDKRTIEIILDNFKNTNFVIADRDANNNLLRYFYPESKKYHYINTTDDNNDLTLFNEEGEIGKMPRFDVAVMNPPWDIHLKIIEKVLTYADNVVNISPIRWLQDPLATYKKNSDYNKFENTISKRIKDIEIIDSAEIDKMFGIQYNTTVAVYHFDTKGGYDYESLMDSKSKNYRKIYKSVMKKSSACPELKLYKDSKKKNFVPVCLLSGHIDALNEGPTFSRDRYRYFVNNKCINPNRKDVNGLTPEKAKSYNLKTFDTVNVAEFDTANECANFYDYITSPFFVYMCKCHSMDGNVTPKYLPFMEDYKTKRTNDEIFDYFNVSDKNKKFIYQELKRLQ